MTVTGAATAWPHWLAATGYLLAFEAGSDESSPNDARVTEQA